MTEYLKCPYCKQTRLFKLDILITGIWDAETGELSDYRTPQVTPESYIRCIECDSEGELKDFYVGGWNLLSSPDDIFLDDIHDFETAKDLMELKQSLEEKKEKQ